MLNQYNDVMSILDLCEVLGIGRNSAYSLLASGTIHGFRLGRTWKIPKIAVEDYLRKQAHNPPTYSPYQ